MVFRSWSRRLSIGALICCLIAIGTTAGAGAYDLHAENAIETPEETVTFEGNSFTIDHIGVASADGTITASVTAPNESHSVELRNSDQDPVIVKDARDDDTVSFNVESLRLDPGSYMLLLYDQNYQEAVPVVVSGYDIDATATESTASDLTISATVTPTASSGQPSSVEAVVWDGEESERLRLDGSSGSYEGTISLSKFDDSYQVYVSALGEDTLYKDENEILGISEATLSDDSGSDGRDSSDIDDSVDDTDSTNDDGSTNVSGDDSTNVSDGGSTNDTDGGSTNDTDDGSTDPADGSVIQPNDPDERNGTDDTGSSDTSDDSGSTDDRTPLSPLVAVAGLVAAALLAVGRDI